MGKITDTQPEMEGNCALYCCAPAGKSYILLQSCVNPITSILVFVFSALYCVLYSLCSLFCRFFINCIPKPSDALGFVEIPF